MTHHLRTSLAAIALFFMLAPVNAQLAFGVKGGVNFNTLKAQYSGSTAPPDTKASGMGFHMGFFLVTSTDASAAMRFELLYSRRATSEDYDYTTGTSPHEHQYKGHADFTLEYMEVPVFLSIRASEELSIHVGAAAAVLISASSTDEGTLYWTDMGSNYSSNYSEKGTD